MKTTLLCLAVLGSALAVPNGYYHQEYNYKTSSSSYKNNELQHKTDDQGYYKKDGDLEGRTRPRVDSNSEHSEYVNPNLRNGQQQGYNYGAGADLTSNGQMLAQNSYGTLGSNQLTEGLASSDHLLGYSSGSSYGSSHSYAGSSLRSVLSRLQANMEQDLRDSLYDSGNYGYQRNTIEDMEDELRRNMTERINAELLSRYGQQTVRGGQTYSIHNGRVESAANYDNQELANLKLQLENSLLDKLRREYSQRYSTNNRYDTHSSSSSNRYQYYTTSTTIRPGYQTLYPTLTTPRYQTNYYDTNSNRYTSSHNVNRYTPAVSITTVASGVQNKLDARLNEILDEARTKYFSSSSAIQLTNADVVLNRLRDELRGNLTYLLDQDIRKNYGSQELRDGYYYTPGSSQSNYAAQDLENLKSQIERNLIEKLNRDFETYRSRWSQSQSWSSHSNYGSQSSYGSQSNYDNNYGTQTQRYVYSTTPRYNIDNTYGGSSSNRYDYGYQGSSGNTGIKTSMTSGVSSGSIAQLQSKLQSDLSRQLQQALTRRTYDYDSGAGSQGYNANLQQLRDEMNRNISRNIQEYSASGSYGAYGDFSESQMAALRSQLESNLMRQLQQGLEQSFQTHQSYSSSASGSSAYSRPVRAFQNYQSGQYMSGVDSIHRAKRSYGYRSRPLGISTSGSYGSRYPSQYEQQEQLGQQTEDVETLHQNPVGQQEDDSDLTQQVEDSGFDSFHVGQTYQMPVGQQEDDSDLTQQVEDSGFVNLQVGNQNRKPKVAVSQQVQEPEFTNLQVGNQNQQPRKPVGQEEDDSDLTQQVEDSGFGNLQVGNQYRKPNKPVQEPEFSSLQVGHQNQRPRKPVGQEEDTSDLTQQVEVSGFGNLQIGNQHQHPVGQQEDDSDLTQQVQEPTFGQLEVGNQNRQPPQRQNQQAVGQEWTQQVQEPDFGKLEIGNQQQPSRRVQPGRQQYPASLGQQEDNSDLTQQVEETEFSSQHVRNTNQKPVGEHSYLGFPNLEPVRPSRRPITHVQQSSSTNQYESSVGITQQVHYTGHGTPGAQVTQQDLDIIVSTLEQNLSKELQKVFDKEQTNGKPNIPEIVRVLQTKITVPGRLTQQQLTYVMTEIQTFISREIRRRFGDEYNYTIQFGTSVGTANAPTVQTNTYILEGFTTAKFNDFTSTQINICQDIETTLSLQLKLALSQVPSGLSNAELRVYQKKLQEELLQNITRIVSNLSPEESTLFTTLQIHRIKTQLEKDLKQQLDVSLYKPMTPHNIGQENIEDELHSIPKPKPPSAESHVTEPPQNKPSQLGPKSWVVPGFTEKQTHFCIYLEDTLTKKLNDVIESQYTLNYSPNKPQAQVLYQQLLEEIKRNVTSRLDGYSTYFLESYMSFNKQQVEIVKSQLIFNLELKLKKQLGIENNRGDMTPDQVGPHPSPANTNFKPIQTSQKPQVNRTPQHEVGQQEEIGQQQEETGQEAVDDSFEKLEPIKPLNLRPGSQVQENHPVNHRPSTPEISSQPNGEPQWPGSTHTIQRPTTRKPVNSFQFMQTEIQQQETDLHIQGQFTQSTPRAPQPGSQFGVTGQGQVITQEQTPDEAENNADALLDMLRKKQNSQDLKPVQENANPEIMPGYGGYENPTYGGNHPSYQPNNQPTGYQPGRPTYGDSQPAYHSYRPTYGGSYGSNTPTYGGSYSPYTPISGSASYDTQLNYGQQETLDTPLDHSSDFQPIRPSQASAITHPESSSRPNYNAGVKGRPRYTTPAQVYAQQEESSSTPVEIFEETTPIPDSELPWWKRFGNKVKSGASKLKEKIVG